MTVLARKGRPCGPSQKGDAAHAGHAAARSSYVAGSHSTASVSLQGAGNNKHHQASWVGAAPRPLAAPPPPPPPPQPQQQQQAWLATKATDQVAPPSSIIVRRGARPPSSGLYTTRTLQYAQ